jgi:phenylalanyl-tRNA synthetase alpha chain
MSSLHEQLSVITAQWQQELAAVSSHHDLESLRIKFLGKKGLVVGLFGLLGAASLEEKRACGPLLNEFKKRCDQDIKDKKIALVTQQAAAAASSFDVTAYEPHRAEGTLHPYTHIIREIENIFVSMGFDLLDGPEVETDNNNFTALNIPADHPARDMYDTFWLNKQHWLMRTHTSTVQIRAMKTKSLPLAGISTGRVFRHEAVDASHDHTFMQCEGILITKKVSLSHLFGVIKHFIGALFGTGTPEIRIRPGFFPFVEPGLEVDMRCPFCTKGCATCKKTRWIEVFPAGLIHPNVLQYAGIDPNEHSGFAFGFGLTRLAMLKYGIADIRALTSGKVGFLRQFS